MNIKEIILPITLALMVTAGIQYFMGSYLPSSSQSNQSTTFVAPKVENTQKPLNTDINFIDTKRIVPQENTMINVSWADLTFCNDGAVLKSLDYKRVIQDDKKQMMSALLHNNESEREKNCFMLAFDNATPYYYSLIDQKEYATYTTLTYQSQSDSGTFYKTFTIYNDKPVIDLEIKIDIDKQDASIVLHPRLFFTAPYLPYITGGDVISSLVIDNTETFNKKPIATIESDKGWITPHIFGMDDRYFIHALLTDENNFTQRAYYKFNSPKEVFGILESGSVSQSTAWKLSFYCGPKDIDVLLPIEPRLEKALDYYGWFAPISKGLLKILKWLYQYFHNYGIAIIVLTFLLKLILLPLTFHGEKNMRQQKEMQKKVTYIQQKYAEDPNKYAQEHQDIMKKQSISVLGGCLPLLSQLPMFIALNKLLGNAIELHNAPFFWIHDLSSKDPYYIFPIIMCLGMLLGALNAEPKQRMAVIAGALIVPAITANLSAGLALFLCANSLLSFAQTYILKLFHRA